MQLCGLPGLGRSCCMRHLRPRKLTLPALVFACRRSNPFPAACTCASGWPWSAAWRCSRSAWAGPGALHRSKKTPPPCPPPRPPATPRCPPLPPTPALPPPPPARQMVRRDAAGHPVLRGLLTRTTLPSGEFANGTELRIQSNSGQWFTLQMAPHPSPGGQPADTGHADAAFWTRPPFGFLWLLGIVSLAAAVGVYPIIRRLTLRLETLQRSVQKFGEGDLSVRVPEQGRDEV